MQKIGLLLPKSNIFPTINFDQHTALKAGLKHFGIDEFEIKVASINHGGNNKEIYTACEQLIFDGVEIVVGYLNQNTVVELDTLFRNAGALLLVLDSGYHIRNPYARTTNAVSISLEGTLGCQLLPFYGKKIGISDFALHSGYYDGGYRSGWGFFNGLMETGLEVQFNHVTKLLKEDFTITSLTGFLKQNELCGLFCSLTGEDVPEFFNAVAQETEYKNHPTYLSTHGSEETWLSKTPFPDLHIESIVSWSSKLDNSAQTDFKNAMTKDRKKANIFSVLAWEVAHIIAHCANYQSPEEKLENLKNWKMESPRGLLKFDVENCATMAPMYQIKITKHPETGMCEHTLVSEVNNELVSDQRKNLNHRIQHLEGGVASWLNAYGCI